MIKHTSFFGNYRLVTIFFILVKLLIHFLTNTNYELHRDEMLYFNMGGHLSFGYATVPPFIGIFAFVIKFIFGYSVFGIRFFPAVFGCLSIFIISKIIEELKGGILALVLASTAFLLSGGFLIFDTVFTPNVFEQFFWLFLTYLFLRMVNEQNPKIWIWIGIVCGIAFLNKYSITFFLGGFLISLMFSPHKALFKSKYFVMSLFLATLIILPNLIWQYQHGWPVVHHMNELKRTQLVNMNYGDFFEDLFSLSFLSTALWLFGLFGILVVRNEKKYRYFGIAHLIIILFFFFSHGKAYYILGLVPSLFAFGAYAMEKYFVNKMVWINYAYLMLIICFSMLALPFGLPVFKFSSLGRYYSKVGNMVVYPFSRWEDGKKHDISQVYADMIGWKELAGLVAKAYYNLSVAERQVCTIYGVRNYGYAGAVNFYGKEYNLPEAITFLDSYTLWAPDTIPKGPLIYINGGMDDLIRLFADIKEVGEVKDPYFREKGLKVFVCNQPKADIQDMYKRKAIKEKNIYRREKNLELGLDGRQR